MNDNKEHIIGGPKGCLKPNSNPSITTVNGGSPKLGPGTIISSPGTSQTIQVKDIDESEYASIYALKCALVFTPQAGKPEDGKTYLVYRPNVDTGEPTYSICICKNGNWIPQSIAQFNITGFIGIPVAEDDQWICCEDAFLTKPEDMAHPVDDISEDITKDPNDIEQLSKYVERRLEESGNELNGLSRIERIMMLVMEYIDDKLIQGPVVEQNWMHLKEFTNDLCDRICKLEQKIAELQLYINPFQPGQPYPPYQPYQPYPAIPTTPEWPGTPSWPLGPIVTYVTHTGMPPFVPGSTLSITGQNEPKSNVK